MKSILKRTPRSSKKILFVSSNFPPVIGGSAVVYDQLARNADGHIIALAPYRDYRTGGLREEISILDAQRPYKVHRLPLLRPPASSNESKNWLRRTSRALLRDLPVMISVLFHIFFLIIKYRAEVVCIGELIYGGWLVLPLRYLFGRRVLIYTHGEEISQESSNLLARRRGLFLRHAHRVIAVSLFCKGQIISKYKIDPRKIIVVSNGVDLAAFNRNGPDRTVWPEQIRDRTIILSVSRLVDRKGQDALVRALPALFAKHPRIHCVIVGGGPLEPDLRRLVEAVGATDYCTVVGPAAQDLVLKYFKNCDIFALPCRTLPDGDTEGFGLVFLEAGACGKPVVAGIAGGTVEAVTDGQTGFLINGYNPEEVSHALSKLIEEPALAKQFGNEGWRRAQGANWKSVTSNFLEACFDKEACSELPRYERQIGAFAAAKKTSPTPKLLMTVDVEEEFGWDEFDPNRHIVRGADALRSFHRDCQSIGIRPVYLLTYPILQDAAFRQLLREVVLKGQAEAGIHLHSWTVPPFWEQPNAFTSYQCNLPEHVEARKLATLALEFEQVFGFAVSIHRAGRWGGGARTAALLERLKISVDLSPSAGYTDYAAGGPDFSDLDGTPFWSGPNQGVLTVPASSVNYLRGPRWFSATAFGAVRGWPSLQSRTWKRGKPVRFSPENADVTTLLSMARELKLRKLPTVVYTLHSTSLYPGGNPYSSTSEKVNALRADSLRFLSKAIAAQLLTPASCAEVLEAAVVERARQTLVAAQ